MSLVEDIGHCALSNRLLLLPLHHLDHIMLPTIHGQMKWKNCEVLFKMIRQYSLARYSTYVAKARSIDRKGVRPFPLSFTHQCKLANLRFKVTHGKLAFVRVGGASAQFLARAILHKFSLLSILLRLVLLHEVEPSWAGPR